MASGCTYDFIVVGSGSSGGVVAGLLQRAGAKCLLIEAGKHFTASTFPANEADYSAQMFWGGGLEYDTRCLMGFLRGKCVGGGSIVNQALQDRFDDIALGDWKAQSGIDYFTPEAMDPFYTAAEDGIVLQTLPAEQRNRSAQLFIRGLDHAEVGWAALRRGQCDCGVEQGNDCIACLGGCHRDSKQSTLIAYIDPAMPKGLDLAAEFLVDRVEHSASGVKVHGHNGSGPKTYEAKKCILAGGSFGTTQILLKSGFRDKLPALGKCFSMHPQYMSFAEFDEPVDAHKGAFQTVKSSDKGLRKKGYKLENVYAPPVSIAMLYRRGGVDLQRFMKRYRYYACVEVAVRDEATGELSIDRKGKLLIKKEITAQDAARRDDGLELVRSVFAAVGAKSMFQSPMYFGLHLMGGCAIGVDPRTSVVNEAFQVHGCENLYTADTSIFPNAPGINPALSVMALAHKLSRQLVKG
ncbi:MAG: GMC family oxidoreductase [Candidatus Hydrogenedentes bacterium]|nr:GMC family oxidoreductase [Candidatus Hydrogenedentota bacterium]